MKLLDQRRAEPRLQRARDARADKGAAERLLNSVEMHRELRENQQAKPGERERAEAKTGRYTELHVSRVRRLME